MASSIDTVQFICDQAALGRRLTHRKMFGEYALYVDEKVVALVCDDQLFLKPTSAGRALLGDVPEAPPFPGAKNYLLLATVVDDPERLAAALKVTADALPKPKPKPIAKSNTKARAKATGASRKPKPKPKAARKAIRRAARKPK